MFEDAHTFDAISIRLASPEVIRSWSHGEIKKPDTINYRTFKAEKDGLFCERIFGPVKDWECNCGKYKRIKHKGIVCDRCGVEVTLSKVRRERMGHIELAAPVSHIWFFKAMPSKIAALLELNLRALEKVLYYEEYIVIDPGKVKELKPGQILADDEYRKLLTEYGPDSFKAGMGGKAVRELLRKIDLKKLFAKLHTEFKSSQSKETKKRLAKLLKIVEAFKESGNRPEWMILEVIPVIPPDLRPLVPLDGDRFANHDLNDLYRRVLNRNNRLKRLIEIKAPDVILRNEKRMLQEAVDVLFDNGRHGRPLLGTGNRPLKSLSDMLRGKQGRFRQNLLGKRVDYSGRSVIVIGPELKLHQCGLPKRMALELFKPFVEKRLKEAGFVSTIKSARRMVKEVDLRVWDILEEMIENHPVLLNRAPTLHRLGIQAFQPLLIEGNAIRVHPLVCAAFNADFDGDQMAVHVPLSVAAQTEARLLMLSTNNIFSPSDGRPIISPTQDIVLGCYYITKEGPSMPGKDRLFYGPEEVVIAYNDRKAALHAKIKVALEGSLTETTVGRVLFNQVLPEGMPFVNKVVNKGVLSQIVTDCFKRFGQDKTVLLLDRLKELGFDEATRAGLSIGINDLEVPEQKERYLEEARREINKVETQYQKGLITDGERYNRIIDIWTYTTDKIAEAMFDELDSFNPVFMMADSGARGSHQQIRQLGAMRGLMAKPSGEIIESPITSNFREGLTVLEYFISTHGARKGLADTALKTSDAGYLTRKLIDVAQDVIVREEDCGTNNGITVGAIFEGEEIIVPLAERMSGRTALDNVADPVNDRLVVKVNQEISDEAAKEIEELGIQKIRIRSVLTCEAKHGVCQLCYGRNLATQKLVELGEAIGIIAAQSIGEPGTQLTMRTFHIGGTASRVVEQSSIVGKHDGVIKYHGLKITTSATGHIIVLNRGGQISVVSKEGRELERHPVPLGAVVDIPDGGKVSRGKVFVRWDPYTLPILTEVKGKAVFKDIVEGVTMKEEMDDATGLKGKVIIEHREERHPQIFIEGKKQEVVAFYHIPSGAHIMLEDGQKVEAGDLLAKTPRTIMRTRDITGGLPRVTELFEARRPRNPAIIAEIDGTIELAPGQKGLRKIIIKSATGRKEDDREYVIPHGKHLEVYKGDYVTAGAPLTDGPIVLQDILRISGEKRLQEYLVNEIQEVYRLQGVSINDKHIEVIIRQMLKKVKVVDPEDTQFLAETQVDKTKFEEENLKTKKKKKKPARAVPLLLGITKASLSTESFISAASFQETTRVLTEATIMGKTDRLLGLKENVIMGHLIPAGTGFSKHRKVEAVSEKQEG